MDTNKKDKYEVRMAMPTTLLLIYKVCLCELSNSAHIPQQEF